MNKSLNTLPEAILVKRINRFVAEVILNEEKINVYVPNTGRLSELALPGTEVLLSPINAMYKYKILYIINRSFPVMIDSTYSNRLFHELLKDRKVPGLDHYISIKREPAYENHRFDFLLVSADSESFIELKSCTLFHNKTGSFPDAVSTRASEHVKALAESGKGKLIFLVLRSDIEIFIPNYHTDFIFYETLKKFQDRIDIHAFTVQYDETLTIQSLKEIPVLIPEVKPAGIFLLILFNPKDIIYNNGEVFEKGYYIYCSSPEGNIFKVILKIKRKNGISLILKDKKFSELKVVTDLPVISTSITPDKVEKILSAEGGLKIQTDIYKEIVEENSLTYFKTNPAEKSWFWDMLLNLRFGEYSLCLDRFNSH